MCILSTLSSSPRRRYLTAGSYTAFSAGSTASAPGVTKLGAMPSVTNLTTLQDLDLQATFGNNVYSTLFSETVYLADPYASSYGTNNPTPLPKAYPGNSNLYIEYQNIAFRFVPLGTTVDPTAGLASLGRRRSTLSTESRSRKLKWNKQ